MVSPSRERTALAAAAFAHTAAYDIAVASYLNGVASPDDGWPDWTGATWDKVSALRYGENPHQPAALYRHWRPGLASAEQLHGKEMSYNNYVDVDAAWRAATISPIPRWRSSSTPTRVASPRSPVVPTRRSPWRTGGRTPAIRSPPSAA